MKFTPFSHYTILQLQYLCGLLGCVFGCHGGQVAVEAPGDNFVLLGDAPCVHVVTATVLNHLFGYQRVDALKEMKHVVRTN